MFIIFKYLITTLLLPYPKDTTARFWRELSDNSNFQEKNYGSESKFLKNKVKILPPLPKIVVSAAVSQAQGHSIGYCELSSVHSPTSRSSRGFPSF